MIRYKVKMKLLILLSCLFTGILNCMDNTPEKSNSELIVYAIPAYNADGGSSNYINNFLNQKTEVINVYTSPYIPDLGQDLCIGHLRTALETHKDKKNVIIHAVSQGTATALNYLAHEDKGKCIKALILESVLISGNSAIIHTLAGPLGAEIITNLPLAYYWLPYIAKIKFPFYQPGGKQAIKSIKNLPTNIPIIIIHSKKDPQVSYNGACALYYALRAQGNNSVYLITKEGSRHMNLIDPFSDKNLINEVLKDHKLIEDSGAYDQQNIVNKALFQPDHSEFKKIYDDLILKERNHTYLGYVLLTLGAAACFYVIA